MTSDEKPREFWLAGQANEIDAGIWYDHHPGVDVVYGKEFHKFHVVEKSAYDQVVAERDALKDENKSLKLNLDQKSKEIGRSEHRGNTVDYIYDKCETYKNQVGELVSDRDRWQSLESLASAFERMAIAVRNAKSETGLD